MWKKIILALIIAVTISIIAITTATGLLFAGGDKVRGEKSEGPAFQLGECPFTG